MNKDREINETKEEKMKRLLKKKNVMWTKIVNKKFEWKTKKAICKGEMINKMKEGKKKMEKKSNILLNEDI